MLKAPKFWYQKKISILAILLLPVTLIWMIGTFFKKKFARPIRSKIPVIAVGSAIIGGSGKTPSVIYVCEILEKMGYNPHIISRGYGGSANEAIKVAPEMNYSIVGDEAIMMSKYYPTWVSKNKYNAFSMAEKDGANIFGGTSAPKPAGEAGAKPGVMFGASAPKEGTDSKGAANILGGSQLGAPKLAGNPAQGNLFGSGAEKKSAEPPA